MSKNKLSSMKSSNIAFISLLCNLLKAGFDDEWAKIGAWNHEEAEYIEGWVPVSHLKVVEPNPEYGLLVDKTNQTMTVFRNGERIETLLVSTGRMAGRTVAESFIELLDSLK